MHIEYITIGLLTNDDKKNKIGHTIYNFIGIQFL